MKFKCVLNDLVMYYKIINLLVHIKLPENFAFVEAQQVYIQVYIHTSNFRYNE